MRCIPNTQRRMFEIGIVLLLGIALTVVEHSRQTGPVTHEPFRETDTARQKAGQNDATDHLLSPDNTHNINFSPEQAIARAVNNLTATDDGYRLRNPLHTVTFTVDGIQFTPRRGGPDWRWQLKTAGAGETTTPVPDIDPGAVLPVSHTSGAVTYPRGELVEQYLARANCIEQQFVIPRPLELDGADLVIVGTVDSPGEFEAEDEGWLWRTAEGVVSLGDVRVYDARGREVGAKMMARSDGTRIVVEGAELAEAVYPVTIDPEIGVNDFRISDMGSDEFFDAFFPAVAYNSTNNEYLVVWSGDDNTGDLEDDEFEIYGQLVNAGNGDEIGSDFRISDMGTDGEVEFDAFDPAVAYDSYYNEYLVVWSGDDNTAPLVDEEFEIYGQFIDAAGNLQGTHFLISDMGQDGDTTFDAFDPAVIYNTEDSEYLVVWWGDDDTLGDDEFEIFGQRIDANYKTEMDPNDFRISDMGLDGYTTTVARNPGVGFNSDALEYLVVWSGNDRPESEGGAFEIYGQRIYAGDGSEVGDNDFRISDMGLEGDVIYNAFDPAAVYNSTSEEYLVVWWGDDDTLGDDDFEIFGQRIDAAGAEIPPNDFRISEMGLDGEADFAASNPMVSYNSIGNEYLVVWQGDDDNPPLVDDEFEIFGQRINAAGGDVGTRFRISDMGQVDGNPDFDAFVPAVAYNSSNNEYLVVWHGDDDEGILVDDEFEIFGQRINAATGLEVGDNDFRISDMGSDELFDAWAPAVAYNSTENEYLVVWEGDDNTGTLVDNEFEIFGQLINAVNGVEIPPNDFRISDMGLDGKTGFNAEKPAVAYNSTNNQYLVVWYGDDVTDNEWEIYGQLIDEDGNELDTNDFRISDMGTDGYTDFKATYPAVAYNSTNNQYLVVWQGTESEVVYQEWEIYGQLIDAATADEVGDNDFRISYMGPDDSPIYSAQNPAVAYNSTENEYLVVWHSDDDTGGLINDEIEIYSQLISAAGERIPPNDNRISDMGQNDGNSNFDGFVPAVAYNSTDNEYLVVWYGDDDMGGLSDNEFEIFGQLIDKDGLEVGTDFRISDMGGIGNSSYDADYPKVAYNSTNNQYLVVWRGDDNVFGLVNDEFEIFCQAIDATTGNFIPPNDYRLSDMGPNGITNFGPYEFCSTAVAYNSTNDEYLVVWSGDDDIPPLVDEEYEIFGQRYKVIPHSPNMSVSKNSIDFGNVNVDSQKEESFTIYSTGDADLIVTTITLTSSTNAFSLVSQPRVPVTLTPGDSLPVMVRFDPSSEGEQRDTLSITSNDPVNPSMTVALLGVGIPSTSVSSPETEGLPATFELGQNYPNPFNPGTTFQYQLPKATQVKLVIYNLLGKRVTTLVDEMQPAGFYSVVWDGKDGAGRNAAGGIYLYKLETKEFVKVRKLILVR